MKKNLRARFRKFLQEYFNDEDLTTLCFDYFPDVYNDFAEGMSKNRKAMDLVDYCHRRNLVHEFLSVLKQERPNSFSEHFPDEVALRQEESDGLRPEAVVVEDSELWSTLGQTAEHTDEDSLPDEESQATSLSGMWYDAFGGRYRIQQFESRIEVQGLNTFGQVIMVGQGVIQGDNIQYEARNMAGQNGRGVFTISPDGMKIEGNISWWNYNIPAGTFYIQFFRQQ